VRPRRTDHGTVILHWMLVGAFGVALFSGLRIATEAADRMWINLFDVVLPSTSAWCRICRRLSCLSRYPLAMQPVFGDADEVSARRESTLHTCKIILVERSGCEPPSAICSVGHAEVGSFTGTFSSQTASMASVSATVGNR
jgi:hypothetical protein